MLSLHKPECKNICKFRPSFNHQPIKKKKKNCHLLSRLDWGKTEVVEFLDE